MGGYAVTHQRFVLNCGWEVSAWYGYDRLHADFILRDLSRIGCNGDYMCKAADNLRRAAINEGMTYSNWERMATVMVIGKATSDAELINTVEHEKHHLVAHIAQALSIDPWGEDICYLDGEISRLMYEYVKEMLVI